MAPRRKTEPFEPTAREGGARFESPAQRDSSEQRDSSAQRDSAGQGDCSAQLEATVTAAREGCRAAFDQLVRTTYPDTLRLALALTGDPDDAHDVAQDTYLRAFRAIGRFRGDASVLTWLFRITTNCAHTLCGHRQRHAHDELTTDLTVVDRRSDHDPGRQIELGSASEQLLAAIDLLPGKLREVILLRDVFDLPHSEISSRLSITESAAKVRLHRARRRLHDVLDARGLGLLLDDSSDDLFERVERPARSVNTMRPQERSA